MNIPLHKRINKLQKGHISVTYADNFFLPFARLAAKTFLPPGVLILALKPCTLE
jgi:hypothetical protein